MYHVVAEKEGLRIVVATWKPGQQDEWHSHPVMAVYWLTDCDARVYTPDGKSVDSKRTMGQAGVQEPIESHSFQNLSSSAECKALMVEKE